MKAHRYTCEWCEDVATYQLWPTVERKGYYRYSCGPHLPKTIKLVELDNVSGVAFAWQGDGFSTRRQPMPVDWRGSTEALESTHD